MPLRVPSGSKGVGGTIDRYRTHVKPDRTEEQPKIDYAKRSTPSRSAKAALGAAFALPNVLCSEVVSETCGAAPDQEPGGQHQTARAWSARALTWW